MTPLAISSDPIEQLSDIQNNLRRGMTAVAETFQDLSLPRVDFNSVIHEQLERARELKARVLSPPSLGERILTFIEGPWAPAASDLPERKDLGVCELTRQPFRKPVINNQSLRAREGMKRLVKSSEYKWPLSKWTTVYEYDVPIKNLPRDLHGFSILHLSDIHYLRSSNKPWQEVATVARYLERTKRRIDLILLSGDVVTKHPEDLCENGLKALKALSSVCPRAFMVHGNHDYHGHLPALISQRLESVGFHDINNHHIRLRIGDAPLNIFGVDDAYFGTPSAPKNVPANETNILLTHNLDALRADCSPDIDLVLSGHTHWGEIRLFDGSNLMNMWGYCDNINRQTKHWDMLTERTLSFVHPGLARYYVPFKSLRHPPGIAIHSLTPTPTSDNRR